MSLRNRRIAEPSAQRRPSPHSAAVSPASVFHFHSRPRVYRKTAHHDASNRRPAIMATLADSSLPFSKRRRVTRACDNCKSRKRRCDGEKPCAYCTEHRALCTYDAPYTRGRPDLQTAALSDNTRQTSPRRLSRWRPHSDRNSVTLSTNLSEDTSSTPRTNSRWPQVPLDQTQNATVEDGAQSSRARSPIGGEGVAPMGQYLGPASPFSVGHFHCCSPRSINFSPDSYQVVVWLSGACS